MLFRKTIGVYYENHMKHTTLCVGKMRILLMLKQVVHRVITVL
jgi:hypothetical protein